MARRIQTRRWIVLAISSGVLWAAPAVSWAEPAVAAARDVDKPLAWIHPAGALRIHVVRGLWSREYRLEEAAALCRASGVSESWHTQGMSFGYVGGWDPRSSGAVAEFPGVPEALAQNHVLVLCNINALALSPAQQRWVHDFVEQGGSLLMLGGRFAFGAQYHGTLLEEISPVTFVKEGFDLELAAAGLAIAPGPDSFDAKAPPTWQKSSRVFWRHDVKPRQGSRVMLSAEGRPLLVVGTRGKGRVAMFAGSVMGDPPAGTLGFWEDDAWPRCLAQTLEWLGETRSQNPGTVEKSLHDELRRALEPLATAGPAEANEVFKKVEPLLRRLSILTPDADAAEIVVGAIRDSEADVPSAMADWVGVWAARSLGQRGAAHVKALCATPLPNKLVVGLHLAGASCSGDAGETLVRYLVSGKPEARAEDPLAEPRPNAMGSSMLAPASETAARADAIRCAALSGLAELGDVKTLPAIRESIKQSAAGRFEKSVGEQGAEAFAITMATRKHQLSLLAAVRCGDVASAEPLADALLGNAYVVSRARSGWNGPKPAPENELGHVLWWQAEMLERLRRLPDAGAELLAEPLSKIDDVRVFPVVCAALGGRKLSPAARASLKKSVVKAVALMGGE